MACIHFLKFKIHDSSRHLSFFMHDRKKKIQLYSVVFFLVEIVTGINHLLLVRVCIKPTFFYSFLLFICYIIGVNPKRSNFMVFRRKKMIFIMLITVKLIKFFTNIIYFCKIRLSDWSIRSHYVFNNDR